jgi:ABC-2 type transport system ATP-binding protein
MPTTANDIVLAVEDLRKTYGATRAVDGVSFQVRRGEIFGILGPNGAGKTTTVECLQGLRRRDSGTIRILGLDPTRDLAEVKRRIGSQLQESALPDRIKVWEALDLFSASVDGAAPRESLIDDWGLRAKRNSQFGSLSGGQKQRLLVALALVNRPEVVFLDEMTTGMDPVARRVAWGLIERIRDDGATVVLVTHFMDEAERLCDRIAIVARGKVVAIGTPDEMRGTLGDAVTVTFTGDQKDRALTAKVSGVESATIDGVRVEARGRGAIGVRIAVALAKAGREPIDYAVTRPTLEDVYLAITGDVDADVDEATVATP